VPRVSNRVDASKDTETAGIAYSGLHALTANKFHAAHDVLLHLDELGELLGQIGTPCTGSGLPEVVTWTERS